MISSPCRYCRNRHMPKDLCMQDCEEIKAFQQVQIATRLPPYARHDSSHNDPYRVAIHSVPDE